MEKDRKISQISQEILSSVMAKIEHQKNCKIFKTRIILLGIFSFVIFIALIPELKQLQGDFLQSGALQFMSLLLSDFATIAVYWKEFIFSILEAFPIFETITVLGLVIILISSIKIIYSDINLIFIPKLKPHA